MTSASFCSGVVAGVSGRGIAGSDISASVLGELSLLNKGAGSRSLLWALVVSPFGSGWTLKNEVLS